MATDLFNNLISGMTSVLGLENSVTTKISENISDEKFANVFDNAKSKYMSKESSSENLSKSLVSESNKDAKVEEKQHVERETEKALEQVAEDEYKPEEGSSTVVEKENGEKTDTQEVKETQTDSDVKDETENQEQENKDFAEGQEQKTQGNKVTDEKVLGIVNTTLNNMLLSNVEIEIPVSQETEMQEISQGNELSQETTSTISGEMIDVNTDIKPDADILNEYKATVNEKIDLVGNNQKTTYALEDVEDLVNSEKKNLVESKEVEGVAKSEEIVSMLSKELDFSSSVETDSVSEIEKVAANDTLVRADDLMEQITDELGQKNDELQTAEISQEIIDDMGVTIRSVEKSESSGSESKQGGNAFDSRSNAKEEIIRMTLESNSQPLSEIQPAETFVNNSVTSSTSVAGLAATTVNSSIEIPNLNVSNLSSQQIINVGVQHQMSETETDVLNQISAKLTTLQDGANSKVQIILQPENLGKVSVEILNTKEGVIAKLVAESPQVKEILDKSIESLKNSIATQGVNVNNISVKVEETTSSQNANMGFEQEQFDRESAKHSHQQQSENTDKASNVNINSLEKEIKEQSTEVENTSKVEGSEVINENGSISVVV